MVLVDFLKALKRLIILVSLFLALFSFNLYLSQKLNQKIKKDQRIIAIIEEITEKKENPVLFASSFELTDPSQISSSFETADGRVANLKNFFRKYNSPLFDYAELIVQVSDKYRFDYRLLPAIAMQESNLCRYIPKDSHNCWGWGIYGDKVTKFSSYEEAIETVARGIRKEYLDKGLTTASKIMQKYTPSSKGSWARGVNIFIQMLE